MKQILLILISIITISCKAQIYPLNYKDDVPDGAYYKDLNGELDNYVGLWKGTWNNGKTIYLELKKIKDYHDGNHPYYKDIADSRYYFINLIYELQFRFSQASI